MGSRPQLFGEVFDAVYTFLIRNHGISNLVLDSLKFKKLLELQRKELRNFRQIAYQNR